MPRPASGTTIQRPDLGVLAYECFMEAEQRGFIGTRIMPIFEVGDQSADYPYIPIESILKIQETERAPRGEYNKGDYEFKTGTYSCKDRGWEELLDDVEAKLYQRYFDGEQVATERAVDVILRSQEARIAAKLFNTSNITATADVSTPWSTTTTCTPKSDVQTAKMAMRASRGIMPNALVMSYKVFTTMLNCKDLNDSLVYTTPLSVMPEEEQRRILSRYFGLEVLVGNAIKDSAKKGQTATIADIWDDEYVGLFKISNGGKNLLDPCIGRTFMWTDDSPQSLVVESYRVEPKRSNAYRVRNNLDEAFVFTAAGYLLGNIIHP